MGGENSLPNSGIIAFLMTAPCKVYGGSHTLTLSVLFRVKLPELRYASLHYLKLPCSIRYFVHELRTFAPYDYP